MKIKGMLVFGIAMLLVVSVFTGSMALAQGREETGDTSELNAPADSAWPMFRGSQNHTGRSPYDTSHVDGTEKWSFNTGESMVSSPAIGPDGTIYVGSLDNSLYAFNPDGSK
ncbi:MAG: PQQ-binding-like beta-propeller repeat protein, partial [Candidatus Thermoplasmatota archaeon]|nr:PQQ-binding-like beta-propeller repeat protein [Candidatus Thermoplasmatota archaeon]